MSLVNKIPHAHNQNIDIKNPQSNYDSKLIYAIKNNRFAKFIEQFPRTKSRCEI